MILPRQVRTRKGIAALFAIYLAIPALAQSPPWAPLGGPPSSFIATLHETTEGELLAGNLSGGLFRSTDAGLSWIAAGLETEGVRSVTVAGSGRLFAGTVGGEVWYSDDDGETWTINSPPGLTDIYALSGTPGGSLYASGTGGICRSDDGGDIWHQLDIGMPQIMTWSTTLTLDEMTVVSGSLGMGAVKSTDGGSTWEQILPGSPDNIVYKFIETNGDELFAATALGIYRSDDLGETWSEVPDPENSDVQVFCIDSSGNYLASTSTIPYRSTNQGVDWEPADGGLGDLRIVSLVVGTNGTIFGGTDGDGVYTYGLTTGVGTSHDIPDRFLLLQNYPNPFNGSSTFELALTKSSDVSLIIYDQLGRKVATVIDDRLTPGIYSRRWDASGYSSGVYFYRLQSGNLTVTKKMLLLR